MNSNPRILLVDDEEEFARVLANIVRAKGYDVEPVYDGLDALERIRANEYGLLISDINLPGVNGMELIRRTKVLRPDLPIVVITAYPVQGSKEDLLKMGIVEYMEKPVSPNELIKLIDKILD
ncbi:response regulator [candidate division WOR-3 bacterium]|nr:response regulator [candidate division WOR-3 bacterium]